MFLLHKHDRKKTGMAMLTGIGAGALLMYVFDPSRGGKRRALARDKAISFLRKTGAAFGKRSRDLENRARGVAAKTKAAVAKAPAPGDDVLAERVRAKVGHSVDHPGPISVAARDGWVTLSGPVLAEDAEGLLSSVRSTTGVRGVENLLEIHELEPAP